MPRLSDFDVLSFDCYGTLIDWETGILQALAPWLDRHGADPETVLEAFSRHESAQETETPTLRYPEVLARVHHRLAAELGLDSTPEEDAAFGASIPQWPPFPDSPDALRSLHRYYRLVILSNVDRASFRATEERLGVRFDHVFTAEDIGSYKPDPANFEYLVRELARNGVPRERILHTAQSLFHDHVPARRLGLATAWIDRRRGRAGGATRMPDEAVQPDFTFSSLEEMAQARERRWDR
jgi:2-haloacid dehalogenase